MCIRSYQILFSRKIIIFICEKLSGSKVNKNKIFLRNVLAVIFLIFHWGKLVVSTNLSATLDIAG